MRQNRIIMFLIISLLFIVQTVFLIPVSGFLPTTTITVTTTSHSAVSKTWTIPLSVQRIAPFNDERTKVACRLSSATATTDYDMQQRIPNDAITQQADIIICGGGPAGLLSAIMLGQKYGLSSKGEGNSNLSRPPIKIVVIDRLAVPPSSNDDSVWNTDIGKYYLLGLGGRGQDALQKYGVWENVKDKCVPVIGRKDWTPQDPNPTERIVQKRIVTQVLPRDKLVSVLYEYIQQHLQAYVTFYHGYEVTPIDFHHNDRTECLVQIVSCPPTSEEQYKTSKVGSTRTDERQQQCDVDSAFYMSTKLLIGADGTIRSLANSIEANDKEHYYKLNTIQKLLFRPFYVKRYIDDNQRLYKSIPFKVPISASSSSSSSKKEDDNWRNDLNYSARTKKGLTFEALPANKQGDYCGILLIKHDDAIIVDNTIHDPIKLRSLFDTQFPQFSPLITDTAIQNVALKSMSALPSFRYVAPRLHHGNNCVLFGM
jgi:kynurenine 3-monooxygenase